MAKGSTALLAAIAVAGCAKAPTDPPRLEDFESARRMDEVIRFVDSTPDRCTWSRPNHEICSWRLGNREKAWWTLAPTVHTDYQVNVLCELAIDGSPSERACEVYPRKSGAFPATAPVAAAGAPESSVPAGLPSAESAHARSAESAQRALDEARSVWEVSDLVGDAPDHCFAADGESQVCVWNAGNQVRGYAILAAIADTSERVRLSCSFPSDGSPRAWESCRVGVL